jgi:hypothetical protein
MADYESSGIWKIQTAGPFRHVMVTHSSLSLPAELSERFNKWISMYDDRSPDRELKNIETFNALGTELAKDLKKFLGKEEYVEFQGEAPHDEILDPVPIE